MLALARMPKKAFRPSGPNIPEAQRHTETLKVRCQPLLRKRVHAMCAERDITIAEILEAGLASLAVVPKHDTEKEE